MLKEVRSTCSLTARSSKHVGTMPRVSGTSQLKTRRRRNREKSGHMFSLTAQVLHPHHCDKSLSNAFLGILNTWKWPEIEGLHDFKGKLMHSAKWDESYDYSVGRVRLAQYSKTNRQDRARGWLSSATGPVESRSFLVCCQRWRILIIISEAAHGFRPRLRVSTWISVTRSLRTVSH